MKKIIGIGLVLAVVATMCFSTVALAQEPPKEGTVNIDMEGDNYGFNVVTHALDVPWDSFSGEASSTLNMHQTVTYFPSGNINIDRTAQFSGDGSIDVATNYYDPWESFGYGAHSISYAYVECSGSEGFLSQSLKVRCSKSWDWRAYGGVTNMDIWADGDYVLGFGAFDATGGFDETGPTDPDWFFDFCAADSSSYGQLHVDDAWTQVQHGRGANWRPDSFHVDFGFGWEGNAGSQTTWYGEFHQQTPSDWGYDQPGDINMSIGIIENFVGGYGEIW